MCTSGTERESSCDDKCSLVACAPLCCHVRAASARRCSSQMLPEASRRTQLRPCQTSRACHARDHYMISRSYMQTSKSCSERPRVPALQAQVRLSLSIGGSSSVTAAPLSQQPPSHPLATAPELYTHYTTRKSQINPPRLRLRCSLLVLPSWSLQYEKGDYEETRRSAAVAR